MKKILSIAMVALVAVSLVGCNEKSATKSTPLSDSAISMFGDFAGSIIKFQSQRDSTLDKAAFMKGLKYMLNGDTAQSYVTGMSFGMQLLGEIQRLAKNNVNFDKALFIKHFEKALNQDSTLNEQTLQQLQADFQNIMQRAEKEGKANDPKAMNNRKASEAHMNKVLKEGYTKTASGIAYKVLKEGAGETFKDGQKVLLKYTGRHIDGKEFDSSRDSAVVFDMRQVVPGFAEMLKLMKPGEKVSVVIPSEQAYGEDGQVNPMTGEQVIGPNEALIFDIETVGVAPAEPEAPARR